MQSEITAGLRNALERGQTIEQATQSFINAGYNKEEVRSAGEALSSGNVSTIIGSDETLESIRPSKSMALPSEKTERKKNRKLSILVVILFVLIIFISGLIWLLFSL